MFLHGWGGSRESLRGIATLFQHTHCVHLFDLPGFGELRRRRRTGAPSNTRIWSSSTSRSHHGNGCVVVGHSFGGRVSLRLAARRLSQIRALVLMGVPGLPQPALVGCGSGVGGSGRCGELLFALQPVIGDRRSASGTRGTFGSKDYPGRRRRSGRSLSGRQRGSDRERAVGRVSGAAVWGTDDTETPPWLARRYAELLGGRGDAESAAAQGPSSVHRNGRAPLRPEKIRSGWAQGRCLASGPGCRFCTARSYLVWRRLLAYLRYFQQEGYEHLRFLRWINVRSLTDPAFWLAIVCAFGFLWTPIAAVVAVSGWAHSCSASFSPTRAGRARFALRLTWRATRVLTWPGVRCFGAGCVRDERSTPTREFGRR